jgi:hypothetical protein
MNPTPLSDTKKCPNCGQWSEHRQQSDDRCEHCHELLDPQGPSRAAEMKQAWKWQMPKVLLISINPDDSWPVRALKYAARGGQLLFIATLSFFIWLATAAAA